MKKDLSSRVHLIDEVRGFAIICMVFYHAMFDLVVIFGVDFPIFTSSLMQDVLQPLFAGLFIFISGTAGHYSRSNLKRGAVCFGFGLILTAVTALFMPDELILFGILHFLGIAMMLFPLAQKAGGSCSAACWCRNRPFAVLAVFGCTERCNRSAAAFFVFSPIVFLQHSISLSHWASRGGLLFLRLFPDFSVDFRVFCRRLLWTHCEGQSLSPMVL